MSHQEQASSQNNGTEKSSVDDNRAKALRIIYKNAAEDRQVSGVDEPEISHVLPDADLELLSTVRVRLFGWIDGETTSAQRKADKASFRILETEETAWKRDLVKKRGDTGVVGEDGLTLSQRKALQHFEEFGGHVGILKNAQIDMINKSGAILFIELMVKKDVYATVGTISSLSQAPFTTSGRFHSTLPNFDLRDLSLPDPAKETAFDSAHERLVIWRTTVREQLQGCIGREELPENLQEKSLRRLGLGSLLKDVLFRFAKMHHKKRLTFNIGALYNKADRNAIAALELASNKPSLEHNRWMNVWSLRTRYFDTLLKHPQVTMLWRAFDGAIDDGLAAYEEPGGTLDRKGILQIEGMQKFLQTAAEEIFTQVEKEESSGIRDRRMPWTNPKSLQE